MRRICSLRMVRPSPSPRKASSTPIGSICAAGRPPGPAGSYQPTQKAARRPSGDSTTRSISGRYSGRWSVLSRHAGVILRDSNTRRCRSTYAPTSPAPASGRRVKPSGRVGAGGAASSASFSSTCDQGLSGSPLMSAHPACRSARIVSGCVSSTAANQQAWPSGSAASSAAVASAQASTSGRYWLPGATAKSSIQNGVCSTAHAARPPEESNHNRPLRGSSNAHEASR